MNLDRRQWRRTACGKTGPSHETRRCRDCQRVYHRRWRAKQEPKFIPATCATCGLHGDNRQGVKVYRYPLLRKVPRHEKHSSTNIGSLALCDRCVVELATPSPSYLRRNPDGFGKRAA